MSIDAIMGDENVRQFVKKTLRCKCPDEVFQRIECKTDVGTDDGIVLGHEINVGNRLLIYVAKLVDDDRHDNTLQGLVSHLVRRGIVQRDERGFNRFRLVLIAVNPESVEEQVSDIFCHLAVDERVHLHVIGQDELGQIEE